MNNGCRFLYLASSSPRRRELLEQIGVDYRVVAVAVEETPGDGESAQQFVVRMAVEKACAGQAALGGAEVPVLGADTAVVVDGDVLGKPRDRDDALAMLQRLSGRSHRVMTGVALVRGEQIRHRLSVTVVTFRDITADEARAYWDSGEPCDKAGGYAVQGIAAVFISRLEGSYSGVMGLPLFETAELLRGSLAAPLASRSP